MSSAAEPTPAASGDIFEYIRTYYKDTHAVESFELLARHRPEVVAGYVGLRQAVFNVDENAALDRKTKELIIIAIEVARTKANPPPTGHTRRAIAAGATPAEIAEVVSLCIMIGGMLTYQESGRHVLALAEELYGQHQNGSGDAY